MSKLYLPIFCVVMLLSILGCRVERQSELTDEDLIRIWRVEVVSPEEADDYYRENSPFAIHDGASEESGGLGEWDAWIEFVKNYQDGDELWYFISGPETWGNLMGREGFAIFRNDKLIAHIIKTMN